MEPVLKKKILQDYYSVFIYRDLVERHNIRNIQALRYLVHYLLSNVGNLFSVNKYYHSQKDYKISKPTITEYLGYLEEAFLIFPIKMFSYSLKAQQVNPVKIYCIDPALRNIIAFKFSSDLGRLVENIVFLELIRREYEIYYWKNKYEVDFVVKKANGDLLAINVSYTDSPPEREFAGLKEFHSVFGDRVKRLILLSRNYFKTLDNIQVLPVWKFLLTLT